MMGAITGWRCRALKHITLSVAESEFASAVEMVKELLFMKNMLEWMGLRVKIPMKIYLDNQAAIMMIRNNYATKGSRHCSLRVWYLRDLYMKGIVDPIYVKTEENMSDLLTKNVSRELFERHSLKLVEDIPPEYLVNKLREGADEYG